MSTKSTIRSGQNWSLYEDRANEENKYVYLQMNAAGGAHFSVAVYENVVSINVRLTETQAREMGLLK